MYGLVHELKRGEASHAQEMGFALILVLMTNSHNFEFQTNGFPIN